MGEGGINTNLLTVRKKKGIERQTVLIVKSQINTLYQDLRYCCFLRVLQAEILLSLLFRPCPAFDCGSHGSQRCSFISLQ